MATAGIITPSDTEPVQEDDAISASPPMQDNPRITIDSVKELMDMVSELNESMKEMKTGMKKKDEMIEKLELQLKAVLLEDKTEKDEDKSDTEETKDSKITFLKGSDFKNMPKPSKFDLSPTEYEEWYDLFTSTMVAMDALWDNILTDWQAAQAWME